MDFIRSQELAGRGVESVCAVLREQGVQVAARTYRAARARGAVVSAQVLAMAYLMNAIHSLAFVGDPATSRFRLRPDGFVRSTEDDRVVGP